ncbi:MAG: hypothetical protein KDC95_01305 [Planctomycetes bacterium]|nr:hypothetical protein [Planctomycetota bacterium]
MKNASLALIALTASLGLPAQEPMDNGPMMTSQVLCIVGPGTVDRSGAALSTTKIYVKKGGILAAAEPLAGRPDLRFEKMFHDRVTNLVPAIQVDAISGGLDALNITYTAGPIPRAQVMLPADRWGALLFGVERGATGATGVIGREQGRTDGAGADIFSYLYSDSRKVLPAGYFNCALGACSTRRESDSGEIGLNHPDGRYAKGEITAIDAHLPSYLLDAGVVSLLPRNPRVYFSVSNATLAAVPGAWWGSTTPSGATILMTVWTGTEWTEPTPVVTYGELGATVGDDVDALSVRYDYKTGKGLYVMFSTTAPAGKITSDLVYTEFVGPASGGDPAPVEDGTTDVAAATGKKKTNIKSTCDTDPTFGTQTCAIPFVWNYVFGTPVPTGPSPNRRLFTALYRTCPGGNPSLEGVMTGWTASGRTDGLAVHVWMLGDHLFPSIHLLNTTQPRTSMQPYGGGIVTDLLNIPAVLVPPSGARCVHVWSTWLALVPSGTSFEFAYGYPVRIRL